MTPLVRHGRRWRGLAALGWVAWAVACAPGAVERRGEPLPSAADDEEFAQEPSAPSVPPAAQPASPSQVRVDRQELAFTTPSGRPVRLAFDRRARSVGGTHAGTLIDGRCLRPEGPGYVLRDPSAACGTDEAVHLLMFALGELLREFPDTPPVVIGTLSRPGGGPVPPHKSHQSGRDVDVGLFASNGRPLGDFEELDIEAIDFDKTFFLMANLLASGRVVRILVNYALQPHLVEAAGNMGYDEHQLAWMFQYPRGPKADAGLVRHAPGHRRHFHVRFACPEGDAGCVP